MEFIKFMHKINNAYNYDTCYPGLQNIWSKNSPTLGHCAIVALKFFEEYGGKIRRVNIKNSKLTHYYNVLNNEVFDITKDQFKNNEIYENEVSKTKQDIISSEEFNIRYETFNKRFNDNTNN